MRGHRRRAAVVALVIAAAAAAAALAPDSQQTVVPYPDEGRTFYGMRPTAVGLPDVGEFGTVGVTALAPSLRAYHDSGAYERDLAAVDGAASSYVDQRLRLARKGTRVCATSYRPVRNIPGHGTLYQRIRRCRTQKVPLTGKPAIVLDIDETALSNYAGLAAHDFDSPGKSCSRSVVRAPPSRPRFASTETRSHVTSPSSSSPGDLRRSTRSHSPTCSGPASTTPGPRSTRSRPRPVPSGSSHPPARRSRGAGTTSSRMSATSSQTSTAGARTELSSCLILSTSSRTDDRCSSRLAAQRQCPQIAPDHGHPHSLSRVGSDRPTSVGGGEIR
jgi:hypothetical protein